MSQSQALLIDVQSLLDSISQLFSLVANLQSRIETIEDFIKIEEEKKIQRDVVFFNYTPEDFKK